MARTRIDTRLIATGGVKRDAIASGSIEIGHLNFVATEGAPSWGGVIADGDIVALHDTSADTVRGIEAVDLKSYINSGSSAAGRSGSLQFNHASELGGLLDWTTDGHNITGSNGRQLIFQAENVSGSNAAIWSPGQGELKIVTHGPGSGVNSSINLIARGKGAGTPPVWINIGSGSNREIEYNAGSNSSTSTHQFMAKGTHFLTLHQNAGTADAYIQSQMPGMFFSMKEAPTSTIRTPMYLTSSMPHKQYFDSNTGNAYALVLGASDGTPLTGSALAFRSVTSSVIFDAGSPDKPNLTIKSKGASNTKGTVTIDATDLKFSIGGTKHFTMGAKSGVGILGYGKSGVAIGTSGAFIDDDGRWSLRLDSNNSTDTMTFYSGSTAIFGGNAADMQVRRAASKILLGGGTTYYLGGAANSVAYVYDVTGTNSVSGATVNAHTVNADKIVGKQITTTSLTASGGMMIGNATSDDIAIVGGLVTDLVPQNDSKVDLGTSDLQFADAHIDHGYIDAITVTGTSTLTTVDINGGAIDAVTLGTNSAVTNANFTKLTASLAYIGSLEVDELVSRTVTKDSLEIKDNLIIAGVSGSAPGDFVGAGFQLGGKVGVSGTGSAPLMSLTLGSSKVTGDALVINVDGQAGATFMSGGITQAMLGTPGMRFGVTGSVSGSLVQAKRAEIGHISVGKVSGVALVGSTSVSGATGNFHDLTADDVTLGGLTVNSLTASNGVMIGTAVTDDLSILGGLITDFVPQNDSKVDLGTSAKQFAEAHIDAGYIDAITVTGTSTLTTVDINGGNIDGTAIGVASVAAGSFAAVVGTTGTYSGILKTDDTTAATSTTDGSLQTDGGLSVALDAVVGDDLILLSDASVIHFGADKDITLTHDADNGLRLSTLAANNGAGGLVTGSNIPSLVLHNASNSPADDDYLGGLYFSGMDDASNQKEYGSIVARAKDVTKDTTDGALLLRAAINDTETTVIDFFDTAASTITVLDGAYDFNIASHDTSNGLKLGGTLVTATAAELNYVDIATLGTAAASKALTIKGDSTWTVAGMTCANLGTVTTMDLNGGNIDGTVIGASSVEAGSFAAVVGTTGTFSSTLSGSTVTAHSVTTNRLLGTKNVSVDNIQTGSITAPQLGALSVTKAKLNSDVVINKSDANGGLTWTSGRLSVGWRKDIFVRADGSNISGSVPTHGMFATKAVATPYTTASLGAQPASGSLMVYLNGVLLHGDYVGDSLNAGREGINEADFHMLTSSANAYKVLLAEDLALDSDDVLTITYLSGSGTNS